MTQHLMFLEMDYLIIEPAFTDPLDESPYVFQFEVTDSPLDEDDAESALKDYYARSRVA